MEKILSICIPTYNRKSFLERSINALLPQLCDEVEVLISNNCSPDDTDAYCRTLDPRIKYYKQPENIGADNNFLWLMDNAIGKYVLILSDDDYLDDGSVSKLIEFLNDKEYGLAVINAKSLMTNGSITSSIYSGDTNIEFTEENISEFLIQVGVYLTFISGLIFNNDLLRKVVNKMQYNKTFLLQTCVALRCLEYNKKTAIIKEVCCISQCDNSSGYNIYNVFVENWRKCLFRIGKSSGLPKKTLTNIYNNTLGSLVLNYLIKDRLGVVPFETSNKDKYFSKIWRFKNAWLKIYPARIMPKFILRKITKTPSDN